MTSDYLNEAMRKETRGSIDLNRTSRMGLRHIVAVRPVPYICRLYLFTAE